MVLKGYNVIFLMVLKGYNVLFLEVNIEEQNKDVLRAKGMKGHGARVIKPIIFYFRGSEEQGKVL